MNNITEISRQKNFPVKFAQNIKVRLACVEDGLDNIGFRKFSAYVKSIHPDTEITYVPTGNLYGFISLMSEKRDGNLVKKDIFNIAQHLADSDIVVTTALIPGRPAPILISDEMVKSMRSGSVVMDLAAENGGNCSLTKPDELVNIDGVLVDGTVNLAGTMSVHASQLYAKNVSAFILHGYDKDKKEFNLEDEIMTGSMFVHNGEIVDERTKSAVEGNQ